MVGAWVPPTPPKRTQRTARPRVAITICANGAPAPEVPWRVSPVRVKRGPQKLGKPMLPLGRRRGPLRFCGGRWLSEDSAPVLKRSVRRSRSRSRSRSPKAAAWAVGSTRVQRPGGQVAGSSPPAGPPAVERCGELDGSPEPSPARPGGEALQQRLQRAVAEACWLQAKLQPPLPEPERERTVAAALRRCPAPPLVHAVAPRPGAGAAAALLPRLEQLWREKEQSGVSVVDEIAGNLVWPDATRDALPALLAAFTAEADAQERWGRQLHGPEMLAMRLLLMSAADVDVLCGFTPGCTPRNVCVGAEIAYALADAESDVDGLHWPHGGSWTRIRRWAQTIAVLFALPARLVREVTPRPAALLATGLADGQRAAVELMLLRKGELVSWTAPAFAATSAPEVSEVCRLLSGSPCGGLPCVVELRGEKWGIPVALGGPEDAHTVLLPLFTSVRLRAHATSTAGRAVLLQGRLERPPSVREHRGFALAVRCSAERAAGRLYSTVRGAAAVAAIDAERALLEQLARRKREEEVKARQRRLFAEQQLQDAERVGAERLAAVVAAAGWSGEALRVWADGHRCVVRVVAYDAAGDWVACAEQDDAEVARARSFRARPRSPPEPGCRRRSSSRSPPPGGAWSRRASQRSPSPADCHPATSPDAPLHGRGPPSAASGPPAGSARRRSSCRPCGYPGGDADDALSCGVPLNARVARCEVTLAMLPSGLGRASRTATVTVEGRQSDADFSTLCSTSTGDDVIYLDLTGHVHLGARTSFQDAEAHVQGPAPDSSARVRSRSPSVQTSPWIPAPGRSRASVSQRHRSHRAATSAAVAAVAAELAVAAALPRRSPPGGIRAQLRASRRQCWSTFTER
eukprot:TRINITY_DN9487_c0_g1_i2.p1 TRINITY_DN9487_c0_g1~~TRINITY_DN9487_c0_g1_i2.p1  ORF type:complete len:885 (+),score=130.76 TRINITY_DN9487_c0_g1_i2:75-2657(+)